MKKIILFTTVLSLIFTTTIFSQSKILTVDKAIELTLKNYPLIKQKEEEIKAADYRTKAEKSSLYPNLNAEASYMRIGPAQKISMPGLGSFELFPVNNYDAHLDINQILYDFGKRNAQINLTESYKNSAVDSKELVKSNLSFQTAVTFYSILFLNKSIVVKDTQLNSLNEHLKIINKKIQAGTATGYDTLSTKVKISEVENEKIDLKNKAIQEIIILKKLMGLSQDSVFNLKGGFYQTKVSLNEDSLISAAYNQREEVKLALDAEKTAKLQKELASASDLPSLNLGASYGIKNGLLPNIDVLRGNWNARVSVEVPIFNGFKTSNLEDEAQAKINAAEFNNAKVKSDVSSEVKKAVADLKTELEKLETTKTQLGYAEESLKKAELQYENGTATNLDIIDSNTSLARARLLYLSELYKNVIGNYLLKEAVGDVIWK